MGMYSNETAEQEAVVQYCDILRIPVVHIPNEGKRSSAYGAKLKRAGMRSGFPDLFIPRSANGYHGLFIEMKYGKNKVTDDQRAWLSALEAEGYFCRVCYGYEEAVKTIKEYFGRAKV